MTPRKCLQATAATLACLGMLIPAPLLQAQSPGPSPQGPRPATTDIALHSGGTLVGQVVDGQGRPKGGASVALRQADKALAVAACNPQGYFAFKGLRGGTYELKSAGSAGAYRVWAVNTAPPTAQPGVLMVEGGAQVRGQQPVADVLSTPWVLAALVAAAIAIPIILANQGDDTPATP